MYKNIKSVPILVIGLLAGSSVWSAETDNMTDALPNAKAGQCYAKVLIPATYETVSKKVMVKEASAKIEIVPAQYKLIQEKVIIKPASEKVIAVPAVYNKVVEKILVAPEKLVWRKGNTGRKVRSAPASWVAAASGAINKAEPGQCFVEYHQGIKYKTVQEKVLKREASEKIEIVPAVYKWEEKKFLAKEASEKIVDIPAAYEIQEEKILERAAYTTWKKGRGPIEKLENTTGEIMCLVEVPAKYKIIKKKILKTPSVSQRIEIPAVYKTIKVKTLVTAAHEKRTAIPAEYQMVDKKVKDSDELFGWIEKQTAATEKLTGNSICLAKIDAKYKTVTKQVIAAEATTRKEVVPAEEKLVKVNRLVTAAQEKRIEIPAVFSEVSTRNKLTDEKFAWRQVLCETNTSKDIVIRLQRALEKEGLKPGPVDGVMGKQTYQAIEQFQISKGFETGGLTLRTLESLNVSVQ